MSSSDYPLREGSDYELVYHHGRGTTQSHSNRQVRSKALVHRRRAHLAPYQRQRLQRVSVFQFSSIVPMYLTLTLENGTFTTSNGALKHVANIAPTKPLPNVCTDDSSAEDVGGSACRIRSMSPKYTAFHTQLRHRVGLSPIMKNAFEPPSATSFRQQSNAPE